MEQDEPRFTCEVVGCYEHPARPLLEIIDPRSIRPRKVRVCEGCMQDIGTKIHAQLEES